MFRKGCSLILTGLILFFTFANPAFANEGNDVVGVATSIYQKYTQDGATGEIELLTTAPGTESEIKSFMNRSLDLSTRLVPFSLHIYMEYYIDKNPTTCFLKFKGREMNDLNQQVQNKAASIAAAMKKLPTDYQKIEYLNNYIVDHCSYQTAAVSQPNKYKNAYTSYGCLIQQKAVCEGYANSVQLICQKAGIPCIKVLGRTYREDHVWNSVYINGKWWMLDVTFNDPTGKQAPSDRRAYFLLTEQQLDQKKTHKYNKADYELSKKIYVGETTGQFAPIPRKGLSLQNAASGSKPTQPVAPTRPENASPETVKHAETLKQKGLFMGDDRGFRLNDPMTRVEMGVMVMRMNDGQAALKTDGPRYAAICPFRDVPAWAKSSIGFLYDHKLTAGQSPTTYGTGSVTQRDYAVMMLRVLNIPHTYSNALETAQANGILKKVPSNPNTLATRGNIVDMTYATLDKQGVL